MLGCDYEKERKCEIIVQNREKYRRIVRRKVNGNKEFPGEVRRVGKNHSEHHHFGCVMSNCNRIQLLIVCILNTYFKYLYSKYSLWDTAVM